MSTTANATQAQVEATRNANERAAQSFAAKVRVKDANDQVIEIGLPARLEAKVFAEYWIKTSTGKKIPAIIMQGWTGAPYNFEFVPGYIKQDGTLVQDRFTCHILTGDDEVREMESHRVNFWGPLAKAAHQNLTLAPNGPNTAFIRILGGTISHYIDPYGIGRSSVNVNFERQYQPLILKKYEPVGSRFAKAAMDQQSRAQMNDSFQYAEMDDCPF